MGCVMQNNKDEYISSREEFQKPEKRNGFLVTAERKALWKVLLDILEIVIRICDRHGIRYSMDGGSLLGAMRHKGFIPWDDDIDIAMPRSDYEKLQQILPKELPPHLFMQTSATDHEYDITHVKIRDSRTTALEMNHVAIGRKYNMGIFLDIFPIDGVPKSPMIRRLQMLRLKLIKIIYALSLRKEHTTLKSRIGGFLARSIHKVLGDLRLYKFRERTFSRYSMNECGVGALGISEFGFVAPFKRLPEWFESYEIVPFEYLDVKIPREYDNLLTQAYGEWRVPKQVAAMHNGIVFYTERDYKTVLRDKYGYVF